MSVNDTACSPTGTCVILDGAFTNGTDYVAQYDPNYPVPLWRSRIELSFICIFNTMSRKADLSQSRSYIAALSLKVSFAHHPGLKLVD